MESEVSSQIGTWVFWGVAIIALLYAVMIYNGLVSIKHQVSKSWSNIDVLLKQRHDELPKLVETCKQYMQYEGETLEKIMLARAAAHSARGSGDVKGVGAAEGQLRMGLGQLFGVAENYPDLKANHSFQQLQSRISGLENAISDRRELYNESVNINNVRIEQFPDVLIARMFGFKSAELMEFEKSELADVNIKQLFS